MGRPRGLRIRSRVGFGMEAQRRRRQNVTHKYRARRNNPPEPDPGESGKHVRMDTETAGSLVPEEST